MAHIDGLFEVSINGTPFRVVQEQYARRFLDVVRQQADSGQEPSEVSLNPNDLWRRSSSNWIYGEGQLYFDDEDGLRSRYHTGVGIEPFCGCKKIHPHATATRVDALGAPLDYREMIVTTDALYVRSAGVTTFQKFAAAQTTTAAVDGANPVVAATGVGNTLYAATAGGVFSYNAAGNTWTKINNLVAESLAYVKGRLMATAGPNVYNITNLASLTAPSSLTAGMVDAGFEWTAIGDAASAILIAGMSGESSHLYAITIREDGTALTPPIMVTQFPDGEQVRAIKTYLGVTAIATNLGLRIGTFANNDFVYGPKIYEGTDVYDLESQDKFIYFTCKGGLGKIDLSHFLPEEVLAPAYAMSYQGGTGLDVWSVVSRPSGMTIGGGTDPYEIVFLQHTNGVTNQGGLFKAQSTYEASGQFSTGRITYGMADAKNFMFLEVVGVLPHSADLIYVYLTAQNGTESLIGAVSFTEQTKTFLIDKSSEYISFRFEFSNGDGTRVTKPEMDRWTLRALPVPSRTEQVLVPLDLRASSLQMNGVAEYRDVWKQFEELQALVRSGAAVTYQEFDNVYLASLENIQIGPDLDVNKDNSDWEGIVQVTIRIYDSSILTTDSSEVDTTTNMYGIDTFGEGVFGARG